MAKGEMITAIMTEPNCGSDLKALLTTAEDKGDHYVVNGQKTFITNGHMCDMYIAVKQIIIQIGVTLLIIEAAMEGFNKGTFNKLGMKAQDTSQLFSIM
jgi:alkylation response protein AidB-like acyl-CoA dehydrogenase